MCNKCMGNAILSESEKGCGCSGARRAESAAAESTPCAARASSPVSCLACAVCDVMCGVNKGINRVFGCFFGCGKCGR